jgi:hypothetical protein
MAWSEKVQARREGRVALLFFQGGRQVIRLLIFALVFPCLCAILFLGYLRSLPELETLPMLMGMAYFFLLMPSLVLAIIDAMLERWGVGYRMIWAAIAGAIALLLAVWLSGHRPDGTDTWFFGTIGASSGFFSWLGANWFQHKLKTKAE